MMSNFKDVPVESDTRILSNKEIQLNGYDALHQTWAWEGIKAESLIFLSSDVQELDDSQLQTIVAEASLANEGSQYTIKRDSKGYTFINFNFKNEL